MLLGAEIDIVVPGPVFWVIVALVLPGTLIVVGAVLAFIFKRRGRAEPVQDEPGYFRVLGVDVATGQRREALYHATSRAAAEGRARMDGIIATEVRRADDGPASPEA